MSQVHEKESNKSHKLKDSEFFKETIVTLADLNSPSCLEANDVYQQVSQIVHQNFEIKASSRSYSNQDIFDVVLAAANRNISIEQACKDLKDAPSPNTVRNLIKDTLPEEVRGLEAQLNDAIRDNLPKNLFKTHLSCAIDITEINYYGDRADESVRGGKAQNGTTKFHCYATLYVTKKNRRYTLAITLMDKDEKVLDVLRRLLVEADDIGLKIKRLLLDRGFDNNAVIRYLQSLDFPCLVPLVRRGKKVRNLLNTRKSYETELSRSSDKYGEVKFKVYVACKYSKGRYGKQGIQTFAYIVTGRLNMPPLQAYEEYRRRFGIESSYRMVNKVRIKTCTKLAMIRLFYMGLGFMLLNLWTYLKWVYLHLRQRGPRVVLRELFTLATFSIWLWEVVKDRLGLRKSIPLPVCI